MNYIQQNQSTYTIAEVISNGYFMVDYQSLIQNEVFISQWKNFKNDLLNNSEYTLQCLGLAMHQFIIDSYLSKENELSDDVEDFKLKVIHPRLINFDPVLSLKDIKENYYGKMINIFLHMYISLYEECIFFT